MVNLSNAIKAIFLFSTLLCLFTSQQVFSSQHSALKKVDCWFGSLPELPEANCYYLQVPEDHNNQKSLAIKIPIVHFPSEVAGKSPVLDLGAGGPGSASGLDNGEAVRYIFENLRNLSLDIGRDLILSDPRGVGMAAPKLVCTEYLDILKDVLNSHLSREKEWEVGQAADLKCFKRLKRNGHDFKQYNSLSVAKDIELLRKALNIKKLNLIGVSYASRYAMTYAREFPKHVDSMVLDGPVFPSVRYPEKMVSNYGLAFKKAFNKCYQREACNSSYPNIEERFWKLISKLNRTPLNFSLESIGGFEKLDIVLTGDRFLEVLYQELYFSGAFILVPEIVRTVEENDVRFIQNATYNYVDWLLDTSFSDVSSVAHYCYEEYPFASEKNLKEQAKKQNAYLYQRSLDKIKLDKIVCKLWVNNSKAHVKESEPVRTSVPTLFLHGAMDPVLPVEDLEPQIKHFKNKIKLIFPDVAHNVLGTSACAREKAGIFIEKKLDYDKYSEECQL